MMNKTTVSKVRSKIVAVDLFCGVGGLTHGLQKGNIDVVMGVDIDNKCRHPFESNNQSHFCEQDVTKLDSEKVIEAFGKGTITLLAGCAPCQPFSTYSRGKRGGERYQDWRLVQEFSRLVQETKPDLVTMENVPPLIRQNVFKKFLESLENYHLAYGVLQCAELGIPQSRTRLVLIASRLGPINLPSSNGKVKTVRQTIAGLSPLEAGESDKDDPLHSACRLSAINLERIKVSQPGGTWRDWPEELRAACHVRKTGATYPSVYGRMEWDSVSPTITTQCFGYGNGRFGHPSQNRAITLREAAMLQTFPRDYDFLSPGEKVSFAGLGRLIGNAVPVKLGEEIARVFQSHIRKLNYAA